MSWRSARLPESESEPMYVRDLTYLSMYVELYEYRVRFWHRR